MSGKSSIGSTVQAAVVPTPAADPFGDVRLTTPLLKLAQQLLGPFLAHAAACTAETCSCGLRTAVEDLQRRELLVVRYGSAD